MKLIGLHIYNFGCFKDFKYKFTTNLNTIKEDNGFGKTTLAAFIKYIFYGFENSKSNDLKKSEKKKYTPWNNEIAGGELSFEINDKSYKIIRKFGGKKDEFELFDYKTNKLSYDYTSNIGFEIFKIGMQSFERSCFFRKSDLKNPYQEDITNKLTTIIEGDNLSFDEAIKRLEAKKKDLYSNVNKGKIVICEVDVRSLKEVINNKSYLENELLEKENELKNLNKLIDRNNENIEIAKKQLENKAKIEIVNQYNKLADDIGILKYNIDNSKIDENELNKLNDEIKKIEKLKQRLEFLKEDLIVNKVNQTNQNIVKDYQNFDNNYFEKMKKDIEKVTDNESFAKEYSNITCELEKEIKVSKLNIYIFLTISIVSLILTLVFLNKNETLFIVFSVVSFLSLVSIFLVHFLNKKKKIIKQLNLIMLFDSNLDEIDKKIKKESDSIKNIFLKYKQKKEAQLNLKYKLQETFSLYNLNDDILINNLNKLKLIVENYENFLSDAKENEAQINTINLEIQKITSSCNIIINKYNLSKDLSIAFKQALDLKYNYNNLIAKLKEREEQLSDFIKEKKITKDFLQIENKDNSYNLNKLLDDNNSITQKKIHIQNEKDLIEEKLEEIEEAKFLLEEKIVYLNSLKYDFECLKKTIEYLNIAQDNLSSTYISPMKNSFLSYLKLISSEFSDCVIDTNLDIKMNSSYGAMNVDYYSNGYNDIFEVCMRFALVDNIFTEMKPFLIFDDPFVNLDDAKMDKMLKILHKVSEDKQIIYFTCNKSRI